MRRALEAAFSLAGFAAACFCLPDRIPALYFKAFVFLVFVAFWLLTDQARRSR